MFEIVFLGLSGLLVALFVSWLLLGSVNFSYGFWHDHGGIGEAIEKFGPANKFKYGFQLTSKAQREDLFHQINQSIHHKGRGLSEIRFKVEGAPEQLLLREPEIQHLKDVSNLVATGKRVGIAAFVVWLLCWLYFACSRRAVPLLWQQSVAIGVLLVVICLAVVLIGPVKVFYWLHTVIFPDNHQWFFYYQESLMSTMMYAPILFGWIALEWLLLTVALFLLLQGVGGKLVQLYLFGR